MRRALILRGVAALKTETHVCLLRGGVAAPKTDLHVCLLRGVAKLRSMVHVGIAPRVALRW